MSSIGCDKSDNPPVGPPVQPDNPELHNSFAEVPYGGSADVMITHNAYRCETTSDADWLKCELVGQMALRINSTASTLTEAILIGTNQQFES